MSTRDSPLHPRARYTAFAVSWTSARDSTEMSAGTIGVDGRGEKVDRAVGEGKADDVSAVHAAPVQALRVIEWIVRGREGDEWSGSVG